MRGGTVTGARHVEELYRLVHQFDCRAAFLGQALIRDVLINLGVPLIACEEDVAQFYRSVFAALGETWPQRLLVVGDGGKPQGVPMDAYAYPEIVQRQLMAIAADDAAALERLRDGMQVESLWSATAEEGGAAAIQTPAAASVAEQTSWMAERWQEGANGFILGDPELISRWTPTAAREGWSPLFGIPQSAVIAKMQGPLEDQQVIYGRQQDDRDFLELSKLGVAFQLIDPGRPPFPVLKHSSERLPVLEPQAEPDDAQLTRWAAEGRVLATVLFWTGMARELESLYPLADLLQLTRLAAGVVLTNASFEFMREPPLSMLYVPETAGGLAPRVEPLLASAGLGAYLESQAPSDRFDTQLQAAVRELSNMLGGPEFVPKGWWGVMDTSWSRARRAGRVGLRRRAPFLRLRFDSQPIEAAAAGLGGAGRTSLRAMVRESPLAALFEARRPFDAYTPEGPSRTVLQSVRDAGFEYAFTKSRFGGKPAVATGIERLTVLNYTVGHWDGWTPFVTIHELADLRRAEKRLQRRGRPGWLAGTIDSCLWLFTGSIWDRGQELRAICKWLAAGGDSGGLINVAPRTVARYARLLSEKGLVHQVPVS